MSLLTLYCQALSIFSSRNPAFLYALFVLFACFYQLGNDFTFLFPLPLFILPFLEMPFRVNQTLKLRLVISILLFFLFSFYISTHYVIPKSEEEQLGYATMTIETIREKKTYFGRVWSCQGTLLTFKNPDLKLIGKNLPFRMTIPNKKSMKRPEIDKTYHLSAKLHPRRGGEYFLTTDYNQPWDIVNRSSYGIGEWRYKIKKKICDIIHSKYTQKTCSDFLCGIIVGEFDSPELQLALSRFGLQHIMAISGFHFAIIATIFHFFLKIFLPRRYSVPFLIFLLSSYYLFLGCGPSIIRAWLTITLALFAQIVNRQTQAINTLGVAAFLILMYDPFMCYKLGFQFSTLTTAGILFFFQPVDYYLSLIFRKRRLSEVIKMGVLDQYGYIFLSFFRQGFALMAAVNCVAVPLMLFTFGKFPYLSLIYNLFFPILVSISMFLLIIATLADIFFSFGSLVHHINGFYTQLILSLASDLPTALDVTLRVSKFPVEGLVLYFTVTLMVGVVLIEGRSKEDLTLIATY